MISEKSKLTARKKRAEKLLKVLKQIFPRVGMALRYGNNWELLVAVMLSAQCTDKKVNEVTARLFKKYLTLDSYAKARLSEFEKDIHSTGFYRNKAKNIIAAANMVQKKFGGVVPNTMEEILELPGVARKTANVVLGNAYGVVEGIAVDGIFDCGSYGRMSFILAPRKRHARRIGGTVDTRRIGRRVVLLVWRSQPGAFQKRHRV